MTTLQTPFPSGMIENGAIPAGKLAYFRERLKNRLHEIVFLEFLRQEDTYGLTKAELGRRIGKPPERITRLLAAPGNWTLDTVSDLLLGMASEMDFTPVLLVSKITSQQEQGASSSANENALTTSLDLAMAPPPPSIASQTKQVSGLAKMTGSDQRQI